VNPIAALVAAGVSSVVTDEDGGTGVRCRNFFQNFSPGARMGMLELSRERLEEDAMRKFYGPTHSRLQPDFAFVAVLCLTLALILSMLITSPAH
jgi:hypothetical protein